METDKLANGCLQARPQAPPSFIPEDRDYFAALHFPSPAPQNDMVALVLIHIKDLLPKIHGQCPSGKGPSFARMP
jgi:hypothetical protein